MTIRVEIRGTDPLELDYLLIDVNGTLSNRGELLDGVADRLRTLAGMLDTLLLSADTFGTLDLVARELGVA